MNKIHPKGKNIKEIILKGGVLTLKTEQEKNKSKQNKRLGTLGAVGIVAVLAVVLVTQLNGGEEAKNPIDLNEPRQESNLNSQDSSKDLASNEEPKIEDNIDFSQITEEVKKPTEEVQKPTEEVKKPVTEPEKKPAAQHAANTDVKTQDSSSLKPTSQAEKPEEASMQTGSSQVISKPEKTSASNSAKIDKEEPKESAETEADETLNAEVENLSFDTTAGLAWPLKGDILMGFSVDHGVYHATLEQFRTNPAVLIKAEAGDEVISAAKGLVTKVENDAKLGVTVTVALGDEYQLIYGQLQETTLKAGDSVEEGSVIGTLASASKFYRMEGDHLYFQVMQADKSIDPMLLLRSEE